MKTKSRKRLLISSVAMLLVAMLALGTATFAWFTQDTTAYARNFGAKTVKASELKLSSKKGVWTDDLDYAHDEVLKPVSTVNGKNWFTAVAAKRSESTASVTSAKKLADGDIPGYAIVDQLNIQNQGGAAVNDVTINFTLKENDANNNAAANRYLRIALVKVDKAGDTKDTDDTKYADKFASSVYAVEDDTAKAIESLTTVHDPDTNKETVTAINEKTISATGSTDGKISISVGPLGAYNKANESSCTAYYNLYAWFEGQDTDCQDSYAGNVMPDITFTVTGNTVQQTGK